MVFIIYIYINYVLITYLFSHWKIDKRWIIPNIGKLELLYLENQLTEQALNESKATDDCQKPNLLRFPANLEINSSDSPESSANSLATDLDIKQYCRAIDLPGFEDNISPGHKKLTIHQKLKGFFLLQQIL